MWRLQGGGYDIALRLNEASAAALTSFRFKISTAAGYAPKKLLLKIALRSLRTFRSLEQSFIETS
jgi:hypothetical protein